jgi:hypothetical protein
MTITLRKPETRHGSSLAETRGAPHGGFKRLALPAVAAAVQTLAQAKSREQVHEESAPRRRDGEES